MNGVESPQFTIIVPVCDDHKITGLFKSLEACEGFDKAETIIVKNGPSHPIDDEIERFVERNSRVRVIETGTNGCSSSRNLGITNAQGDWVVSLDSDAQINRHFLTATAQIIAEKPDTDVVVPTLLRDEGETTLQRLTSAHFTQLSRRERPPIHNPGLVINRKVYDACGLLDERVRHGNDNDFKRRLTGKNVVYSKKACVFHSADPDEKFIQHTFKYGRDKSLISRTNHCSQRANIAKERLTKLLFFPKLWDHRHLGLQMATYEATIGFIGALGFLTEEAGAILQRK